MSYLYAGTIRSWQGTAQAGASVTVYTDAGGTVTASLTDSGGTPIANPTSTDARGRLEVYSTSPTLWYKVAGDSLVMRLVRFCDLTQAAVAVGDYPNAVRDFGAVGNGSADDTTALQDALDAGVPCVLPAGVYKVTDSLVPVNNGGFVGSGGYASAIVAGVAPPSRIVGDGGFAILDGTGITVTDFLLRGIGLIGSTADSGSRGIYAETANNWTLENIFGHGFADQGIWIRGGVAGVYRNIWVEDACADVGNHSDYIGAIQWGADATYYVSDIRADMVTGYCYGWNGTAGHYASGYHCGILAAVPTGVMTYVAGSWSETGIRCGYCERASWTNCRADWNQGHGFDVAHGGQKFIGNTALNNSQTADATYSGFRVRSGSNTFDLNEVYNPAARKQLYGFEDDVDLGQAGNYYGAGNVCGGDISGGLYHITSWGDVPLILGRNGRSLDVANAPAINGRAAGYTINGAAGLFSGSGSPEGAVTAAVGSLYMRTDGGAGTSMYVKESGTGNTGWQPK